MTYRTPKLSEKYNKPEGVGVNSIQNISTGSNVFCRQHHSVDVLKKKKNIYFNFYQ